MAHEPRPSAPQACPQGPCTLDSTDDLVLSLLTWHGNMIRVGGNVTSRVTWHVIACSVERACMARYTYGIWARFNRRTGSEGRRTDPACVLRVSSEKSFAGRLFMFRIKVCDFRKPSEDARARSDTDRVTSEVISCLQRLASDGHSRPRERRDIDISNVRR